MHWQIIFLQMAKYFAFSSIDELNNVNLKPLIYEVTRNDYCVPAMLLQINCEEIFSQKPESRNSCDIFLLRLDDAK